MHVADLALPGTEDKAAIAKMPIPQGAELAYFDLSAANTAS